MNQEKVIEYWNEFIQFAQEAINLGKGDKTVAIILLLLGCLILMGMIWMLQALFSMGRKKNRKVAPYDAMRVQKYNEELSQVVDEGNVMIEMLENKIRTEQNIVTEIEQDVKTLQEERDTLKEEIRLMQEAPTELADSLKRDNAQKLRISRRRGNRKAVKMMFLGLFLGFIVTTSAGGYWIYDKYPDTFKAQFSNLQSYVTGFLP